MRRALLVSYTPPASDQSVHGIFQRLDMFAETIGRAVGPIDALFFVPHDFDASAAHAARLSSRLTARWKVPVTATLTLGPTSRATFGGRFLSTLIRYDQSSQIPVAPHTLEALRRALAADPALVFAHRLPSMNLIAALPAPAAPVLFDMDDVEHITFGGRNLRSARPIDKLRLAFLPAMVAAEIRSTRRAHTTCVCSDHDRAYLGRWGVFGDRVCTIPNAVEAVAPAADRDPSLPPTLLFVGSLSHPPNLEAARFLAHDVLPNVRRACPAARLELIGAQPQLLTFKGGRPEGVDVLGFVADLAPHYARAAVVCSPIFAGSGTRFKVIEAAAHGRPVVATRLGALGLNLVEGREVLVADDAGAFARACLRLITDAPAAAAMGAAARERILAHYERSAIMQQIERLISRALGARAD